MISENASVNQAIEKIKESGFSRIPVYRIRVDDIVGYISAYDLIGAKPEEPLKKYIRRILIFSEYTPLPEVIESFKLNREHIGVVVDERGLIIGILTLEDILREIVGSIHTERGEEELIKEISQDRWIVDGKLEVNELNRIVGVKVPEGNYSTVGGLVSFLAGRVPEENEVFKIGDYRFRVVSRNERRVEKVLIEKERVREKV
jgi:CBS domain containing-hemolysin-like protein